MFLKGKMKFAIEINGNVHQLEHKAKTGRDPRYVVLILRVLN